MFVAREFGSRESGRVDALPDAFGFARTALGFEPDDRQREVLVSEAKRGILNCSRQWGKSTVTAAKAVHRAHVRAGSLVLVASPSERQSAEFLRKASAMVRKLGVRPRGDGDNATSLLLPNGSRISVGCARRGAYRAAGNGGYGARVLGGIDDPDR